MDDEAFLAAYERESTALAEAAEGHLDDPVPSIEAWTVADVVDHMGCGDRWILGVLEGLSGRESLARLEPAPSKDELLDWYRVGAADLGAALAGIADDAVGW